MDNNLGIGSLINPDLVYSELPTQSPDYATNVAQTYQDLLAQAPSVSTMPESGLESYIDMYKGMVELPEEKSRAELEADYARAYGVDSVRDKDLAISQALSAFGQAMGSTPGSALQAFNVAAPAFTQSLISNTQKIRDRDAKIRMAALQKQQALTEQSRTLNNQMAIAGMGTYQSALLADNKARVDQQNEIFKESRALHSDDARIKYGDPKAVIDSNATDAKDTLTTMHVSETGKAFIKLQDGRFVPLEAAAAAGANYVPAPNSLIKEFYQNKTGSTLDQLISNGTERTITTMTPNGPKTVAGVITKDGVMIDTDTRTVLPVNTYVVGDVGANTIQADEGYYIKTILKNPIGQFPIGATFYGGFDTSTMTTDTQGNVISPMPDIQPTNRVDTQNLVNPQTSNTVWEEQADHYEDAREGSINPSTPGVIVVNSVDNANVTNFPKAELDKKRRKLDALKSAKTELMQLISNENLYGSWNAIKRTPLAKNVSSLASYMGADSFIDVKASGAQSKAVKVLMTLKQNLGENPRFAVTETEQIAEMSGIEQFMDSLLASDKFGKANLLELANYVDNRIVQYQSMFAAPGQPELAVSRMPQGIESDPYQLHGYAQPNQDGTVEVLHGEGVAGKLSYDYDTLLREQKDFITSKSGGGSITELQRYNSQYVELTPQLYNSIYNTNLPNSRALVTVPQLMQVGQYHKFLATGRYE